MAPVKDLMLSDIETLPSMKIGEFTLELELGDLSPELQEVARKELRETPDVKRDAVKSLKELLKAETDLKVPLDKDEFLIRFLRPCKYYPESARDLIKRYYAFKIKHFDVYNNLLPSNESNVFTQDVINVLPTRDQCGRRMLILALGKKWNHHKCTLDEIYKGVVLLLEAALLEPATQVAGGVVIFDMDGLSLQQTWQFTPPFAKRIVDWLQDAIPVRLKNLHVVNQPYIFNMVFALFKPFLREKLKKRIIFHGSDRKSLHKYISPSHLPKEYGGTLDLPPVNSKDWYDYLLLCDKEYKAINSYGYKK